MKYPKHILCMISIHIYKKLLNLIMTICTCFFQEGATQIKKFFTVAALQTHMILVIMDMCH